MKKKIGIVCSLCLALALVLIPVSTVNAFALNDDQGTKEEKVLCEATLSDDFAEGRVAVVLKNAVSLKLKDYKASDFAEVGCKTVEDLSTAATSDIKEHSNHSCEKLKEKSKKFHKILNLELKDKSKEGVLSAIKELEKREDVLYAGPDYKISLGNCESNSVEHAKQEDVIDKAIIKPGFIIKPETRPNDEFRNMQWAINKIQLPKAWNYTTGASSVVVGVLDTGVDYTHPDLDDKIVTSLCYDFVKNTSAMINPSFIHSHGTVVSGIIAAESNNGIGIAGTCWNAKIASLRIFDASGNGYSSDAEKAIQFADEMNIPILNLSGRWYNNSDHYDVALDTAISNYDGIFICAAGNEALNNDDYQVYPANYSYLDNVISVGVSDQNDDMYLYGEGYGSNYGKTTVDLFAPGCDIYSTTIGDKKYDDCGWGTSYAAPYVTGVAALLLSEYPFLTAAQIKTAIVENVDKVSALGDYCKSGGRLNAFKALGSLHKTHRYGNCYSYSSTTQHASFCPCLEVYNLEPHWAYASSIRMYNGHKYATCACCKTEIDIDDNPIITLPGSFSVGELETMGLRVIESPTELANEICTLENVSEYYRINEILSHYDELFFEKYNIVIADNTDKSNIIDNLHMNTVENSKNIGQKESILFGKDCEFEEVYV